MCNISQMEINILFDYLIPIEIEHILGLILDCNCNTHLGLCLRDKKFHSIYWKLSLSYKYFTIIMRKNWVVIYWILNTRYIKVQ